MFSDRHGIKQWRSDLPDKIGNSSGGGSEGQYCYSAHQIGGLDNIA